MIELIVKTLLDKKGEDITIIDVSKRNPLCDNFIICSANNVRQLETLAKQLDDKLAENNLPTKKIQGKGSNWLIVDAGDAIVHIFTKEEREKFNLEKLWGDFPIKHINTNVEKVATKKR